MKWIFGTNYSVEWVDDSLTGMPKNITVKGFEGQIIIQAPPSDDDKAWYVKIISNKNNGHYLHFRFNEIQLEADRAVDEDNVDYCASVTLENEGSDSYYHDEYTDFMYTDNPIGQYINDNF